MKKILLFIVCIIGCNSDNQPINTRPFRADIGGYSVSFPVTLSGLKKKHDVYPVWDGHYRDTTNQQRADWFYDWHKYPGDIDSLSRVLIYPDAPLYGVSISIKNTASSLDSIKTVLEKQIKKPMAVLTVKHLNLDVEHILHATSPVYICSPTPGVYVSLRSSSCWKGDYPYPCGRVQYDDPPVSDNPENSVRISVSFGIQPDEEERFALGSGPIWKRVD